MPIFNIEEILSGGAVVFGAYIFGLCFNDFIGFCREINMRNNNFENSPIFEEFKRKYFDLDDFQNVPETRDQSTQTDNFETEYTQVEEPKNYAKLFDN